MRDGQAAKEEYTNIVQVKSSALPSTVMILRMLSSTGVERARNVKGDKKVFYRFM